ncbi:Ff.00g002750.m01.CDS01 [Fusarium sp. VM40]|nr:Ff.00g002750.m01.CDS01 [Fusarium sp. VM40]
MAGDHSNSFLEKLKSYSNNESFSDIAIRYEDTEFKAHTVILSCHSEYFAKQLAGSWKESIEKVIHITDFDNSVIEAMLHFIYHFEYTDESKEPAMVFHAKVYQIADKYGIFSLKEHAKQKFSPAVKASWSTEDFPITINVVYTTTLSEDRGLRDLVVETSNANLEKLISRDGFCQALRSTTDFAADLVPFTCGKMPGSIHHYRCPFCERDFHLDDPKGKTRFCPRCGRGQSSWDKHKQVDGKCTEDQVYDLSD